MINTYAITMVLKSVVLSLKDLKRDGVISDYRLSSDDEEYGYKTYTLNFDGKSISGKLLDFSKLYLEEFGDKIKGGDYCTIKNFSITFDNDLKKI